MARNILIRNMSRLAGLRHLHLCLSLQMPWSTYFSPAQTSRFVSAIENLHTLAFLDFADDPFIEEVGRQCFNLGLYLSILIQKQVSVHRNIFRETGCPRIC